VGDRISLQLGVKVAGPVAGLDGDIRRANDKREGEGEGTPGSVTSVAVRLRDNDQDATKLPLARLPDFSETEVSVLAIEA